MKFVNDVTNDQDVIDSRDLMAFIEEKNGELEGVELNDDHIYMLNGEDMNAEYEELEKLLAFAEEWKPCSGDYQYGSTAIRDSYFEDYARELHEEINGSKTDMWPYNCIDWERAANMLQMDYTSIEFDGVTYWVR